MPWRAAITLGLGSLLLAGVGHASVVFDSVSAHLGGAPGAGASSTSSTPNTAMGAAVTLAPNTTTISGFDLFPVNQTETTFTGLKFTIYVWDTVNTGTVSAAAPAFGNLLGQYSFTASGTFSTGSYYIIENEDPALPGAALSNPLVLNDTTIGLAVVVEGTTDGTTYQTFNNLTSLITYGHAPTVGSAQFNGYYRNASSELNGNFTSAIRSLGNTDQTLGLRIHGDTTTHAITAAASPAGDGSLTCTPNPVPDGGSATCTALPHTGFTLADFTGCSSASGNICTLTNVTAPAVVTANFQAFTVVATLPAGIYGTPYSQQLNPAATGGQGSINYTYTPTSQPLGVSVDSAGLVTAPASLAAGSYTVGITATDANGGTTAATDVTVTIAPAALTIQANNASMVEGGIIPTLTASYANFVNGDTSTSLLALPTLTTSATSASAAGTYPITASGASSVNYAISYVAGNLTITASTHAVGGTVSGLASGASVVLQNNGGDNLPLTTDGAFTFAALVAHGSAYNVSVLTQPDGQTCMVQQGSGTMGTANVGNVAVTCTASLRISTSIFGNLQAGKPFSQTLTATGGVPPYTWTATDPSQPLPSGLSLSASGELSGTPTSPGSYTTLIAVADSSAIAQATLKAVNIQAAGDPVTQVFTGSVAAAAVVMPVPTLGQWALMGMSALLALFGLGLVRKHPPG